ncbi:MAG: 2-phosphosulfolactate phosphatase [Firmicutes bacterium]|nr:2-phosphosulfolactate phosphatase [Bacillota bacterium]
MKITVIPWVESEPDWPPVNLADQTVVVIDVLRATSTIVTALAHGVSAIIPVLTPEEALLIARPGDVLAGERGSQRLPGFDLGNSPREFTRQSLILPLIAGVEIGQKVVGKEDRLGPL